MYKGDIRLEDTVDFKFTSRRFSTGAPFTLAGSPVISAYIGNSTTQLTAGITLTVDFDAVTGLNNVRVVATAANGYAAATNIDLVITTGTVDSVSVVGEVVASFSIEARSALMPTTVARKLDVSAGGEAGIDWANIGSPTTAQNLSATNIDVDQVVASVSGAVGSVTGAVGSVTGAVGSVTAGVTLAANAITAAATAADFTTEIQAGLATAAALDIVDNLLDTEIADIQARLPAALVGGRMDASLGAAAANTITASALAADAVAEIADQVWDEVLAGHVGAGSAGEALAAAGTAGDPWTTALPGAYGAGTAGKIVGDNVNATISSRMATYTQPAGFLAATFPGGTVANTTNITAGTMTTTTNLTTNNDKTGYGLSAAAVQAVWDALTSALTTVGSIGKKLADWTIGTAQTGDSFARIGAAGAGLTAVPWNAAWDAEVQSEAADAITAAGLATAAAVDAIDNFVDTEVAAIKVVTDKLDTALELDGAVYRYTLNSLELAPTGGSAPTVGQIADEVQTRTIAAVTVVNGLAVNTITAAATSADFTAEVTAGLSTLTAAQVNTEVDTAIADAALPTAVAIADAVLDEAVDGAITLRQSVRLQNSALGGKASGLNTTTAVYRDLADTKDRITATVDVDGNRTAVTRDLT